MRERNSANSRNTVRILDRSTVRKTVRIVKFLIIINYIITFRYIFYDALNRKVFAWRILGAKCTIAWRLEHTYTAPHSHVTHVHVRQRVIRFTGVCRALWGSLAWHGNPETAVPLGARFSRCSRRLPDSFAFPTPPRGHRETVVTMCFEQTERKKERQRKKRKERKREKKREKGVWVCVAHKVIVAADARKRGYYSLR